MKNIVIIMAHPDDAEISCFGTIKYYLDKGYNGFLIIVTKGENDLKKTNVNIRQKETLRAFRRCKNVTITFKSEEDGNINLNYELISQLEKEISSLNPEIVITHYCYENLIEEHQDHIVVGNAVLRSCKSINSVKQILLAEPVFANTNFTPNLFVNISKYLNDKINALAQHDSQKNKYYMNKELVKTRAIYNAIRAKTNYTDGNKYFESFYCHYQMLD